MLKRFICIMACMMVSGGGLAAGTENTGVAPVDIPKYGPLIPVRQINGSGMMGVFTTGNRLYAVGSGKLFIYDISAPLEPKRLGCLDGLGEVRQIVVRGDIAYVAARQFGLWLIDVSEPRAPHIRSRFDTVEMATGIDVAGSVAFVALRQYGVEFVDVSDSRKPSHLGLFSTPEAQSLVYDRGRLLVGNWEPGELSIIDISGSAPRLMANPKLNGYGDGLAVHGNLCFAATGHHAKSGDPATRRNNGHGLDILDLTDPMRPHRIGRVKFPPLFCRSFDFWTVRLADAGKTAVVADSRNGVFLVDVGNPGYPRPMGQIRLPSQGSLPGAVSGLAVIDGAVYISGVDSGLYVAALPTLKRFSAMTSVPLPRIRRFSAGKLSGFHYYDTGGKVRAVAIKNNIAFVAAGGAGLQALKLSNAGIALLKEYPLRDAYDVKIAGDRIYVAAGMDGLLVYRYEKEGTIKLLGRYKPPKHELVQFVWAPAGSRFVVVSTRGNVLRFLDLTDPARIVCVLTHGQRSLLYSDLLTAELVGSRYVANNWHSGGLAWYDMEGEKPTVANRVIERLGSFLDGVCAFKGKLLMTCGGKYMLLHPNQPGPSREWKRYSAGEFITGTLVADGNIVVSSNRPHKQVRVYDFTRPEAARPIPGRRWNFHSPPGTPAFWNGRVVVPLGYQGLALEKKGSDEALTSNHNNHLRNMVEK